MTIEPILSSVVDDAVTAAPQYLEDLVAGDFGAEHRIRIFRWTILVSVLGDVGDPDRGVSDPKGAFWLQRLSGDPLVPVPCSVGGVKVRQYYSVILHIQSTVLSRRAGIIDSDTARTRSPE